MGVPKTAAGHAAMAVSFLVLGVPCLVVRKMLELPAWSLVPAAFVTWGVPLACAASTFRLSDRAVIVRPLGAFSRAQEVRLSEVADTRVLLTHDAALSLLLSDGRTLTFGPWGILRQRRAQELLAFAEEVRRRAASSAQTSSRE